MDTLNVPDQTKQSGDGLDASWIPTLPQVPAKAVDHVIDRAKSLGADGQRKLERAATATKATLEKQTSVLIQNLKPEKELQKPPCLIEGLRLVFFGSYLNYLIIFLPLAWALRFSLSHQDTSIIFTFLYISIIPLGNLIGILSEDLSMHTGVVYRAVIRTTMGNSVELISAIIATTKCELRVVQSALIGTMLCNMLLVLGSSFIAGGILHSTQHIPLDLVQIPASTLAVVVFALLLPTAFHTFATIQRTEDQVLSLDLGHALLATSRAMAVFLIFIYLGLIFFQVKSHASHFSERSTRVPVITVTEVGHTPNLESPPAEAEEQPKLHPGVSSLLLVVVIGLTIASLEWLVGSIVTLTSGNVKFSKEWVAFVLLPFLSGNTSERIQSVSKSIVDIPTACVIAAVSATTQIALFIIPLVICIAWCLGKPLTLLLDPFEAIVTFFTVILLNSVMQNGQTTWFDGVILFQMYLLIVITFWYYPGYDPAAILLHC